jgi:hypothetical protein
MAAVLLGFLLAFAIIAVPVFIIQGLRLVLESSTWTLTYREVKAPPASGV